MSKKSEHFQQLRSGQADQAQLAIAPLTVDALRMECHRMVDRLAKHPQNLKLLLGVHQQLGMFLGYKRSRGRTRLPK